MTTSSQTHHDPMCPQLGTESPDPEDYYAVQYGPCQCEFINKVRAAELASVAEYLLHEGWKSGRTSVANDLLKYKAHHPNQVSIYVDHAIKIARRHT